MHISGTEWGQLIMVVLQAIFGFYHGKNAQKNNDSKL